jgi:mRNA interferase MazF
MEKYQKNFDAWHVRKKILNEQGRKRFYFYEREIWWCALGINIGFEQDGKNQDFSRPVIIIRRYGNGTCLVLPLTSKNKEGKYYFYCGTFGEKKSVALLSQLRVIDQRRLLRTKDIVSKNIFKQIKDALVQINFS